MLPTRPCIAGLAVAVLALCGCHTVRHLRGRLHPTLEHTVMVGYQGWYRTPGDGTGLGWAHYEQPGTTTFAPGHLGIDYWPDVRELPAEAQVPSPFKFPDGTTAPVFSSDDPRVTDLHFRWLQQYGIDGAFVQRFAAPIIFDDEKSHRRLRSTDDVLRSALVAAERHGRSIAVMYDLSGMPPGAMRRVMEDWRHVVGDLHATRSGAYQFHHGRPVVAVWGVGFDDHRAYTLAETAELIDFLKNDPVFGGNTVMLGIPTWWREQTADATSDPAFHALLQKADILSPWTPGRYYDLGGVRAHTERFWLPDRAWCQSHGLECMPVVFPGFSWRNLKGVHGGIDRLDGRFLWEQYRQLVNEGFTMVYQAMFDEMDEGTQIFKTTDRPPPGANALTYRPLPSDYYLWLVGTAADHVHRGRPMPARIADRDGDPMTTAFLRANDERVYRTVPASLDAQRAFFKIEDGLDSAGNEGVPFGEKMRVRVSGKWFPRHLWSDDSSARVEWQVQVPRTGRYRVSIRYPGDPNQDHARAARLRIRQGEELLAEDRVNLRQNTLRWIDLGEVALRGAMPCTLVLDRPQSDGALILFEPQLTAR